MLLFIAQRIASTATIPTAHGNHQIKHNMLPDNISTLFSEALNKFKPISGQTMESHLTEICEVLSQIFLVIP